VGPSTCVTSFVFMTRMTHQVAGSGWNLPFRVFGAIT
jgi:hypothetical protein